MVVVFLASLNISGVSGSSTLIDGADLDVRMYGGGGGLVMILFPFPSYGIISVCPSGFAGQLTAVVELSAMNFICSKMSTCAQARNM